MKRRIEKREHAAATANARFDNCGTKDFMSAAYLKAAGTTTK
jgi:hypothetical protein